MQHAAYPVVGVNRNGTLLHDHLVAFYGTRNLCHHGLDIRQVRGAAIALRSAHGDEDCLALLNGLGQLRCEHNLAAAVLCQELGQMFLKDGHTAIAEQLYPHLIVVDADDLVTHVRKTGCRNQPNVSGPDHAN